MFRIRCDNHFLIGKFINLNLLSTKKLLEISFYLCNLYFFPDLFPWILGSSIKILNQELCLVDDRFFHLIILFFHLIIFLFELFPFHAFLQSTFLFIFEFLKYIFFTG
jgi:hypothetical protein